MSEHALDLLGRRLTVREPGESLLAWLEALWHFPEHAGQLESGWTFTLERGADALPEGLLARAKPLEGSFNPLQVAWEDGGEVWLLEQEGGVKLALDQGREQVLLTWHGQLEHADALHQGISEALRASGLVPLHASVAVKDGVGTAFLGPSGTGKTTTLLHAIAAGWTPVAEDFSWLEPHSLRLFSWDRALNLLPDTLERARALFPAVDLGAFEGRKKVIPFGWLATRLWSCTLKRLVVLERDADREGGWEPLEGVRALSSWYASTGFPVLGPLRSDFARQSGGVLERLERRRLVLGSETSPL